jgi:hypothetical protein
MPRTAFLATLGTALLIAAPISAQVGSPPPNSYALTNARIVARRVGSSSAAPS